MVDLVGVRRRYRAVGEVLRGVDLHVTAGGPCVIVGANGSGKSTLLRIAAGVSVPSAGWVRGRPAVVGFLPAPFPASSRLSVSSYLRHLAAMHGGGPVAQRRAGELLERLGFTGARDGAVSELSTGNAQKVGVAQALCASPGLVVLDEPWSGLDADAREALSRCLTDLSRTVRVLLADHTGRGADLPGARVHGLRDGVVQADDTAGPVATRTSGGGAAGPSVIELWCPSPVEDVLSRLPAPVSHERVGSRVRVLVDPSGCDAWVAAALAQGCSLLFVQRETPGTRR